MPGIDDRACQRRLGAHLLADQEEGRSRTVRGEQLEDRRRPVGVWPVIERQHDLRRLDPALDVVGLRERGNDRRRRGHEPVEIHVASERTSDAADGSAARARPGARREPSTPRSAVPSSRSEPTTSAMPWRSNAALFARRCAATPAVGDRRAAAHVRLQHGQPAGRVDERVGGAEPLAHLVGEADEAHARLAAHSAARAGRAGRRSARRGRRRGRPPPERARCRSPRRDRRRPSHRRRRSRSGRRRADPSASRASPRSTACANSGRVSPCTASTSASLPATSRTSSIDSGCVTRWRSTPGAAQ